MITITISTIPFVIACALFLVIFFIVCLENDGTVLLPVMSIGVSLVACFAIYGFAKAFHLF